jgi:hypothetical protein
MRLTIIIRKSARAAVFGSGALVALGLMSGCVLDPGEDAICTSPGPNSPGWPYCAPSDPGGHGPADDPIDPTGRGISD